MTPFVADDRVEKQKEREETTIARQGSGARLDSISRRGLGSRGFGDLTKRGLSATISDMCGGGNARRKEIPRLPTSRRPGAWLVFGFSRAPGGYLAK